MTAAILTRESVVELTEKIVAEKGREYVYPRIETLDDEGYIVYDGEPTCHYVRDGAPSCLVGHVFAALGIPIERIALFDKQTGGASASMAMTELRRDGLFEADEYAEEFLIEVQARQDGGDTWGEAVFVAKERLS